MDAALAVLLVLILPGHRIWRSIADKGRPAGSRRRGYLRTIVIALALIGLLALQWLRERRAPADLGLAPPTTAPAIIALGLAAALLVLGAATVRFGARKPMATEDPSLALLPRDPDETAVFFLFVLVVGCAWEILYRGFLLWFLPPRLGLPASIAVASLAYGLAHGVANPRMASASLISALLFTLVFVASHSLWALMILHCGLPIIGLAAARRRASFPLVAPPTQEGGSLRPG